MLRYSIDKCPKVSDGYVSVALGYKVYSDATLMSMKKSEIIETLRVAEHNYFAAKQTLDIQFENVKNWFPVVHGYWIADARYNGKMCSCCYAIGDGGSYCSHCGAKMDKEDEE